MLTKKLLGMVAGLASLMMTDSATAQGSVYTLPPRTAAVSANDPFVCHREINLTERMMRIPAQLLESVALTESGKWNKTYKRKVSWPWTLNAKGKGYYFNTKAEAVAKVRELQRSGIRSIDVGCMQVNLYFHKDAFTSVEMALEPAYNVRYAAKFLTNLKNRHGTWSNAVGYYHSGTPERHNTYRFKVLQTWRETRRTYATRVSTQAMRQRFTLLEQRRMNRIRIASYEN
jgi:soluble lytic murein transglycosylase-like protein